MEYYSGRMKRLITQLSMLPGIGQKTVERLGYHIVKLPKERSAALANAIRDASENVSYRKTCFCTSDEDTCPVCRSQNRNHWVIMVVENDNDMAQLEKSGAYDGRIPCASRSNRCYEREQPERHPYEGVDAPPTG